MCYNKRIHKNDNGDMHLQYEGDMRMGHKIISLSTY